MPELCFISDWESKSELSQENKNHSEMDMKHLIPSQCEPSFVVIVAAIVFSLISHPADNTKNTGAPRDFHQQEGVYLWKLIETN